MSHKIIVNVSIAVLILSALLTIPISTQAQSACGAGTYTVPQDETIDTLAAACGISTSDLYAANPGIGANLYAGQVLTMPGGNCWNCAPGNAYPAPDNGAPNYYSCSQNNCAPNYNNCYQGNCSPTYSNCYQGACAPTGANGSTYVVQYGDTFSGIASRFGISMYDLWSVNQNLVDYNLLYPGQVLNIPLTSGIAPTPPPSYGYQSAPPYYGYQSAPPYYGDQSYPAPYEYQSAPPSYGNQSVPSYYGNQSYPAPYEYQSAPPSYGNQSAPHHYGYQPYPPYYGPYPPYYGHVPTPMPVSTPISYGTVAPGAPRANIELSNSANAQVFVSLEGTARDGTSIVREYQVYGTFTKEIPAGYYNYTAWVGGVKFSGSINLPGGSSHSLTFRSHAVDAK